MSLLNVSKQVLEESVLKNTPERIDIKSGSQTLRIGATDAGAVAIYIDREYLIIEKSDVKHLKAFSQI